MARRFSDEQREQFVADYIEYQNYTVVAKKHSVSETAIRNAVAADPSVSDKLAQKAAEGGIVKRTSDKLKDLTGRQFGKLTVIRRSDSGSIYGKATWECQCNPEFGGCGNIVSCIRSDSLLSGFTTSCGCSTAAPAVQDEYDHSDSAERLKEFQENRTTSPAKTEDAKELSLKMSPFVQETRRRERKGFTITHYSDPELLSGAVNDYIQYVLAHSMVPTQTGLAIWLGVSSTTLNTYKRINDKRSFVLAKFDDFLQEYFIQQGFNASYMPTFTMYYLKAFHQRYDSPSKIDVNHTINVGTRMVPDDIYGAIDDIPDEGDYIDAEYEEID